MTSRAGQDTWRAASHAERSSVNFERDPGVAIPAVEMPHGTCPVKYAGQVPQTVAYVQTVLVVAIRR